MRASAVLIVFLVVAAHHAQADWFDDLVSSVHEKVVDAADYLKEKAAPAVREKFNSAKETLQDPETHRGIQDWLSETAIPFAKDKVSKLSDFVNTEVVPEVQKIYNAAQSAAEERASEKKLDD